MDIPLDFVTGAVALATFALAGFTARLANATSKVIQQTDLHHQEDRRPFLSIEFFGSSPTEPFGECFRPSVVIQNAQRAHIILIDTPPIRIRGQLRNSGGGLATDVVAYINFGTSVKYDAWQPIEIQDAAFRLTRPKLVCSALAAGEEIKIDLRVTSEDTVEMSKAGVVSKPIPLQQIEPDCHEVVLQYTDMFGQTFRTVHRIGFPQDLQTQAAAAQGDQGAIDQQRTQPDLPGAIFLEGKQVALTNSDRPPPPRPDPYYTP